MFYIQVKRQTIYTEIWAVLASVCESNEMQLWRGNHTSFDWNKTERGKKIDYIHTKGFS